MPIANTKPIFDRELHKKKLALLLFSIFEEELFQILAFKGGTALHFFYELPRFSTDLDFETIKPLSDKETEKIQKLIEKICRENQMTIKDSAVKRNTILVEISYLPRYRRIKIEISKRPFFSKWEIKDFYGTPVRILKPESMLSQKLIAVSTRKNKKAIARDIFDLWFMLTKEWQPDEKLITTITNQKPKKIIEKAIETVKSFPSSQIIQGIGEMIAPEVKEFIRQERLKKQLLNQLKALLFSINKRKSFFPSP